MRATFIHGPSEVFHAHISRTTNLVLVLGSKQVLVGELANFPTSRKTLILDDISDKTTTHFTVSTGNPQYT